MSTREISVAFTRIAELALQTTNGGGINTLPGAWRHMFTDAGGWEWDVATNGHKEPVDSPLSPGSPIEPFDAHVYVNGWPFAIINPFGEGVIGQGEGANEDSFIAALEAETRRLAASRSTGEAAK